MDTEWQYPFIVFTIAMEAIESRNYQRDRKTSGQFIKLELKFQVIPE